VREPIGPGRREFGELGYPLDQGGRNR
jgi:hypothetical protein